LDNRKPLIGPFNKTMSPRCYWKSWHVWETLKVEAWQR